ncbi:hypothetical protein [Francisella hispaniensis]|uniref:Uncharacterized protein n=1 Tax=Francisella hispaniensis TaxID=622488 RepID=F4BGN9_9GAMM|nr:hypothetical protein [Francisella hispaniensis]AEE26633.1 hypothetical protein FN3523_1330 [Francisella hispaniensis]
MKQALTITLLATIMATTVYADDLNAKIIESITKYSNEAETAAQTDNNSAIYTIKNITSLTDDIQANGARLAKGLVLTNAGEINIPNAVKPKDIYMINKAAAAKGIAEYNTEKAQINATIEKWMKKRNNASGIGKKIKQLKYDRKIAQKKAQLETINTKIDILKDIENGDKDYAEEKITQFNNIKDITINSHKAYFNYIDKPVSSYLNLAWNYAFKLDYVNYRKNINHFWGRKLVLWNGRYYLTNKDAAKAYEFNDITNYLTIQTIKSLQNSDTSKAISLYADTNTFAYTITTLSDLSDIQNKIVSPKTAQSICEANLIDIKTNARVSAARNIINGLADQKTVETILTQLLDKTNDNNIKIYDLDKLGNNWTIKAVRNAINATIGSKGMVYIKDHTLMLRSTKAIAGSFANAIVENEIYKQVSDADSILFGENACNFTAANNSNNPIAKAMLAAAKQIAIAQLATSKEIAKQLPKGQVVDAAFKEKVYLALQATMLENLNKILSEEEYQELN